MYIYRSKQYSFVLITFFLLRIPTTYLCLFTFCLFSYLLTFSLFFSYPLFMLPLFFLLACVSLFPLCIVLAPPFQSSAKPATTKYLWSPQNVAIRNAFFRLPLDFFFSQLLFDNYVSALVNKFIIAV